MSLPPELQYNIMSFIPFSPLKSVCKEWGKEIDNIQKKSVDVISEWYWKRRVQHQDYGLDIKTMIRNLVLYATNESFLTLPEAIVYILGLNDVLLDVIQPRLKKSDVRDWMINLPITLDDWYLVLI